LLDSHGESLFIDLLKYFNFDLAAFLAGGVASSPRLILTMIRHLPEGSNYVATLQSAPVDELLERSDEPAEIDPVQESQMWTQDRILMAQLINSVNMLVRHSIQWQDGKAPNLPLIGPASWRGEGANSKPSKPLSVMDVINNVMGYSNV
jgi:hypothetical protein